MYIASLHIRIRNEVAMRNPNKQEGSCCNFTAQPDPERCSSGFEATTHGKEVMSYHPAQRRQLLTGQRISPAQKTEQSGKDNRYVARLRQMNCSVTRSSDDVRKQSEAPLL